MEPPQRAQCVQLWPSLASQAGYQLFVYCYFRQRQSADELHFLSALADFRFVAMVAAAAEKEVIVADVEAELAEAKLLMISAVCLHMYWPPEVADRKSPPATTMALLAE